MERHDDIYKRDADGNVTAYQCASCSEWHPGFPTSWGFPGPDAILGVPQEAWEEQVTLGSDQCVLALEDGTQHYLMGMLEVPVTGRDEKLTWSAWVRLSEADYARASELWETEGREKEPPYEGTLASRVPGFPDTLHLKARLHTQPVGTRPTIEVVEPVDHAFCAAQREGISPERMEDIVRTILHG